MTNDRGHGPRGSVHARTDRAALRSAGRAAREEYAAVALGSALGATCRFGASLVFLSAGASGFPWATLAVNVAGSFVIGFFHALTGPDGRVMVRPATRRFVMAGFCGGLTTFSIFSLETVMLATGGRELEAVANVGLSLLLWIPAAGAGYGMARRLTRLRRA